jgi:hypothetical protein
MSQNESARPGATQNFTLSDSPYAVLDAYDSLALARCSDIYLKALEHYVLSVSELDKEQILQFLQLYFTEVNRGLNKTADILKAALERNWEGESND